MVKDGIAGAIFSTISGINGQNIAMAVSIIVVRGNIAM
jgi:hypothetical protein